MSVKKFKFVSPGIFINEIDNSQVPKQGAGIGPVIIGRTLRGPAMRPIQIESFADFIETFGEPVAGGVAGDVWREGSRLGPTYAAYAAQAYLRNASPITFVRLLGDTHPDATSASVKAGWSVTSAAATWSSTAGNKGAPGAYGLYIANGSEGQAWADGETYKASLAAILYVKNGAVALKGRCVGGGATSAAAGEGTEAIGVWVRSDGPDNQFRLKVANTPGASYSASRTSNVEEIAFNFTKTSRLYVRKVLNTNPVLCNGQLTGTTAQKAYFLGPTFDRHLAEMQDGLTTAASSTAAQPVSGQYACLLPLSTAAASWESSLTPAISPWIISQHNGDPSLYNTQSNAMLEGTTTVEDLGIEKLFRFYSLYSGSWESRNLKISIYDIKAPTDEFNPYGSFSVMIRRASDTDAAPQIVERYSSCNLNPASPNFIARMIGDMESIWDDDDKRYVNHGLYPNQSRFLRVKLATAVEAGSADARLLPYGFLGPACHKPVFGEHTSSGAPNTWSIRAPSAHKKFPNVFGGASTLDADDAAYNPAESGTLNNSVNNVGMGDVTFWDADNDGTYTDAAGDFGENKCYAGIGTTVNANKNFEVLLVHPILGMRKDTKDTTLSSPKDAFFGIETTEFGSDTIFDDSYGDMVGYGKYGIASTSADACSVDDESMYQFIFTLDDIRYSPGVAVSDARGSNESDSKPKNFEWVAGSHACPSLNSDSTAAAFPVPKGQTSLTGYTPTTGVRNPYAILEAGCDAFTLPLTGGHDGIDILEANPFQYSKSNANDNLPQAGDTAMDHYAINSVKKAIDSVSDPEVVEYNLMAAPGLVQPSITNHMVSTCENRGDALAVIDIEEDYCPPNISEGKDEAARMPDVDKAITQMRMRSLNSSYGCCFFPWVQIADTMSGRVLWAPPSVAALGTMASSTKKSELWFAPAGFTRGGLTDGAAGIPVNGVRLRLNSKERDKLYEANINPIAQFPAEGIVIFGQKTLQLTASALDRINVRRLMIYLKKEISRMAKTILFDQNVKTTWVRFISQADPFLASVKGRFGLTEYKIILDETTTTPDLIDRNIMYAKILLKPAKAIEYIAIDFVITDSGASFDD